MPRTPRPSWWVYVVRCADGTLYTGVSTDPDRRLSQHNAGTASKYTRSRRPVEMVYRERRRERSDALKREAALKTLPRRAKLALIAAA
ncbi:MAG TPA: GIY-YIG nuclease family protein [Urbifossiella sp.]|nr:GIY-YIG nuclease family protein [Urbifossiella sp.]